MNTEVSAGGIIVRSSRGRTYVLLMKDQNGNWTFPKGKIEPGEEALETAIREIAEEVGITGLTYVAELPPVMYWYFRKKSIKKTVHFFLFTSSMMQKPKIQREEGITDARWVKWEKIESMIGYPLTNRPLLTSVRKIVKNI